MPELIVEHRYVLDPYSTLCICKEPKANHKYQSRISVCKLENNIWGYKYCIDELPFYIGEKRLKGEGK